MKYFNKSVRPCSSKFDLYKKKIITTKCETNNQLCEYMYLETTNFEPRKKPNTCSPFKFSRLRSNNR